MINGVRYLSLNWASQDIRNYQTYSHLKEMKHQVTARVTRKLRKKMKINEIARLFVDYPRIIVQVDTEDGKHLIHIELV